MTRGLRICLTLALLTAALPATAEPLRITTGGVTGIYHALGSAFCRLLEPEQPRRHERCVVQNSQGSPLNLERLRDGAADIALAQADLIRAAHDGTGPFAAGPNPSLRVLFSTVFESLTIVARADIAIDSVDDLTGRRVDFGPAESGSRATALRLMEQAGIGIEDFEEVAFATSALSAFGLCTRRSDAFLFLAAHPNSVVQEALAGCATRLVPGRYDRLAAFVAANPEYRLSTISSAHYPSIETDVETVGVPAFVVADASLSEADAYRLTATVFEQFEEFRRLHLAFAALELEDLLLPCPGAPFHPGALRYLRQAGIPPPACG